MNSLNSLLHTRFAEALGWSLFHFLWEAILIALALAAALFLCRRSSARLRYGLAAAAIFAMPLAFGITFALSLPGSTTAELSSVSARWIAAQPAAGLPSGSYAQPAGLADYLPQAVPFWMAGVFLCYLQSLWCWAAAQRLRRTGVCPAPSFWQERLDRLAARLRVTRPVLLLESALADVPVVVGFLRPVILMPVGLLGGFPPEQLESILIHELAHVRRYDYAVNLVQRLVEGLLFYHPAVWWISGVVRAERENCCDDAVLAAKGDAHAYAVALAALEGRRWQSREPAMAATGGVLARRIRRLLRQPECPRGAFAPALAIGLLLVSVGVAIAAWQPNPAQPPAPAAPPPPARPVQAPPSVAADPAPKPELQPPYEKWVAEDVAYIITDEERREFQSLSGAEQRERFIERFWLRRDPTPTTPENEFKREHYRRIAYANERFVSGIPGWKTDRGRVYIFYGPADEIESHPGGGSYQGQDGTSVPFEIWRYQWTVGKADRAVFLFADPARTGEYRLIASPSRTAAKTWLYVNPDKTVSVSVDATQRICVNGRLQAQGRRPLTVLESVGADRLYRRALELGANAYDLVSRNYRAGHRSAARWNSR